MKASSIKDIKLALDNADRKELLDIALRLIKFRKENKELVTYLLFEATDETGYVIQVKDTLDLQFAEVNRTNIYIAKKNLRKIIRTANKFIKYSNEATTEIEILSYLAQAIKELNLPLKKNVALANLFTSLLKKIDKRIGSLHEDLQFDFKGLIDELRSF
ncbi:hypothetical protein BH09BAC2_BH09BAC2_19440 [soil metagenome]